MEPKVEPTDAVHVLIRVWLPDRPGALGLVASRIGSVGGDIVGIDVVERGHRIAVDEFAVVVPDDGRLALMVREIEQVDGASVEEVRHVGIFPDPRLDALESAAVLCEAESIGELHDTLTAHVAREFLADWAALVSDGAKLAEHGADAPDAAKLVALAAGIAASPLVADGVAGPEDLAVARLTAHDAVILVGRAGHVFRRRERAQLLMLARVADRAWHLLSGQGIPRGLTETPTVPALVVYTRDLRVHDHPALRAAMSSDAIVPLFVFDDTILRGSFHRANRAQFLLDALADVDSSLERRGGRLVVRRGDWSTTVLAIAREAGADAAGVTVHRHPGVTLVEPGALLPTGRDHYQVFTPYHRRWQAAPRRAVLAAPRRVIVPDAITAGDATSRMSAFLHFGCLSPADVEARLRQQPGADTYVRQLCWRDFHAQVLAARPDAAWSDYRPVVPRGSGPGPHLRAWTEGSTGFPVVDAAMRQLRHEGFVHNRGRMIAASFLTRDLHVDWRLGARHFLDWLVDGDIANNNLNWQWIAGTGTDANPHRTFDPTVQARRFDPAGDYVRTYVPELRSVAGGAVHEPWRLPPDVRAALDYPPPIVDHRVALAEFDARLAAHRVAP